MIPLGDAARAYAELGWRVLPLWPDGKTPLLPRGVKEASSDPRTVANWWRRWPNANVAVACGPDSIDVLDIDTKGTANGKELAERARAAGLLNGWIAVVETPSGGRHIWFPGTDQGGGAVGRNRALELKSAGGYALLPPSYVIARHPDGTVMYEGGYQVTRQRDQGAPLDWQAIRQLIDPRPPAPIPTYRGTGPVNFDGLIRHVAAQGPDSGNRNNALFWAACRATEGGAAPEVFRDLVAAAVANGLEGGERQAWATIRSAQKTTRPLVTA